MYEMHMNDQPLSECEHSGEYPMCSTVGLWSTSAPASFLEYSSARPYERTPFIDVFANWLQMVRPPQKQCFDESLCSAQRSKMYTTISIPYSLL